MLLVWKGTADLRRRAEEAADEKDSHKLGILGQEKEKSTKWLIQIFLATLDEPKDKLRGNHQEEIKIDLA